MNTDYEEHGGGIFNAGVTNFKPTGGPHNSLRTSLRAALLCTYIGMRRAVGGVNKLEGSYLQAVSYAKKYGRMFTGPY